MKASLLISVNNHLIVCLPCNKTRNQILLISDIASIAIDYTLTTHPVKEIHWISKLPPPLHHSPTPSKGLLITEHPQRTTELRRIPHAVQPALVLSCIEGISAIIIDPRDHAAVVAVPDDDRDEEVEDEETGDEDEDEGDQGEEAAVSPPLRFVGFLYSVLEVG